jgi:hypothetical protein
MISKTAVSLKSFHLRGRRILVALKVEGMQFWLKVTGLRQGGRTPQEFRAPALIVMAAKVEVRFIPRVFTFSIRPLRNLLNFSPGTPILAPFGISIQHRHNSEISLNDSLFALPNPVACMAM